MPFRWPWAKSEQRDLSHDSFPWDTGGDALSINSAESALALAPVFAAVRIITHGIATLPIDCYRRQGSRQVQIEPPPLLSDPTMFGTDVQWMMRLTESMLMRGEAIGLITEFDQAGYPARVEWVNPVDVSVDDDRTLTRPRWRYLGQPVGQYPHGRLVQIPWFVQAGYVRGLSPLATFMTTFEHGRYLTKFGRDFVKNGAIPSSVLESKDESKDLTSAAAKILKERFRAAASNREPVVISGYEFKPVTIPPEESQFVQTVKLNATQIAAIYGVEPDDIGGDKGGSLTYSSPYLNQQATAQKALRPNAVIIERMLSTLLPPGEFVRINLDAYARADLATRYRAHNAALNPTSGWMERDEVREIEDLEPTNAEGGE
jgi:HK97 family phage portal protein